MTIVDALLTDDYVVPRADRGMILIRRVGPDEGWRK